MKVAALVLLSSLAVVTPSRRYPSYGGGAGGGLGGGAGGGLGGGSGGGFGGGSGSFGGGAPIVFPGKGNGGVCLGYPTPIGHDESQPLYLGVCGKYNSLIHDTFQGHNYHFSWCVDGGKRYVWQGAYDYCKSLGQGWSPVSIESPLENDFIVDIIGRHRAPWIWTSGNRLNNEKYIWQWGNGEPVIYTNWGQTGISGAPQPDNSEDNNERCLSLLNQFYLGDCITWHDIGCHHQKPTICEYSAGGAVGGGLSGGLVGGGGGGLVGGGGGGGLVGGGGSGGLVGGGGGGGLVGGGGGGGRPYYG